MFIKRLTSINQYKNILIGLLFLFSFQCILSQSSFSGRIIDIDDKPIPFAHIRLENSNIGTISNNNGVFKLAVIIKDENKRLIITSIGYETKKVKLTDEFQTITLNEDITQLTEVVVVARGNSIDYAKELIKKAIKAIPENYPTVRERHTGFFRETTTWEENETKPIYIAEAVVESVKENYKKKHRAGDVKLVEFRKYKSNALDSMNFRIYAGSHHIHRFDIVARREAFLSNPDGYKYQIIDTLRQNGKEIYEVLVERKNDNTAHIYIQEETFAIVKADIKLSSNLGKVGANREFFNFTVAYEQSEDKLWRFSNSYYTTAFIKQGKLLNLTSEYVTTNIDTNELKISYLERLQFSEILLDQTKEYNPNFWGNYTIISPNEISESLFKSIDYLAIENNENPSEDIPAFIKKMSFEFGLTWTAIDIAANSIDYTNTEINIQQSNESLNKGAVNFTFSIFYAIKPHFLIGYANESKISKTGGISNDLVIASNFNLNPNGRPINISPRLYFGYQRLDYFLKEFKLEDDIKIDGKKFDSDEVDTFLSQKGFRLKPNIVFSIEQSKSLSFLISFAYNFQLDSQNGLVFNEKGANSFFSKKVFLKNGEENLSITSNQKNIFENTISIGAGIVFRF